MKISNIITLNNIYQIFSDPVELVGEGEYNLNVLKDIKVSDSYLGLDENIRGCQNKEPLYNCTSRFYRNAFLEYCGCLPPNIISSEKVE